MAVILLRLSTSILGIKVKTVPWPIEVAMKLGQPWLGRRSSPGTTRREGNGHHIHGPCTLVIVINRAAGIQHQYFFVITNPAAGMVGMVQ